MTLIDFRRIFFDRYSTYSHEDRQKAYLLFWGSFWGVLVGLFMLIFRFQYQAPGGGIDYRLSAASLFLSVCFALCGYSTWRGKFRTASLTMLFFLSLIFCVAYFTSLYRFCETGIFTHREFFYTILAYTAIFHSRRILIIMAVIITVGSVFTPLFIKPNFVSPINHYVTATLINGTAMYISVSVLLFFSSLINQRSLNTAEKEITAGKTLSASLDQKVKDRTKELKDKNIVLTNIENNLKRYLPVQLVNNIKSDSKDATPEAKRKKLTMFFSDIKDFTQITDAMEPEDMARLLNEYLTEMNNITDEYNGTLAQITGDSLLVFFSAPVYMNDRDHATRCVNMALDMQTRMKELEKKWFKLGIDESLRIRCGINTGMATVGDFGSNTRKLYTAHGMQVNIAARLEQACDPGSILISHSTWALVDDKIQCTEQGQISIKGYHKPVRIYRVETN